MRVNFREAAWQEGMTVNDLLLQLKDNPLYRHFLHGKATVIVNDELIPVTEFNQRKLQKDDEIKLYPIFAGG